MEGEGEMEEGREGKRAGTIHAGRCWRNELLNTEVSQGVDDFSEA